MDDDPQGHYYPDDHSKSCKKEIVEITGWRDGNNTTHHVDDNSPKNWEPNH